MFRQLIPPSSRIRSSCQAASSRFRHRAITIKVSLKAKRALSRLKCPDELYKIQMRINRHTLQLLERLENSPFMQQTRLLERLDRLENSPLMQQTRLLERLDRLENSPLMQQTRLLERLENSPLMQLNSAFLPTATRIASLNAELARAVEPYWAVIASVSAWEASLTARMAALGNPWALQDRLDQSMRGFARLSRLSDAVHTSRPYSEPVGELVANELGVGVEADLYDDTPSNAMRML